MAHDGVYYSFSGTNCIIRLIGDMKYTTVASDFESFIDSLLENESVKDVVVDMRPCTYIDSTDLGILARIAITQVQRKAAKPIIVHEKDSRIVKTIEEIGLGRIFTLKTSLELDEIDFKEIENSEEKNELALAKMMVSAHQNLVDIDEANEKKFSSVIQIMENEIKEMEENKE